MDDGGLLVKQLVEPIQAFPIEVQYDLKKGYTLKTEFPALIEQAVTNGYLAVLQQIIQRDESLVNTFNHKSGLNALHIACKTEHVHVIQWLLENGIDRDSCDRKKGRSAVYFAVKGYINHFENKCKRCVKLLIEAGCNINLQVRSNPSFVIIRQSKIIV